MRVLPRLLPPFLSRLLVVGVALALAVPLSGAAPAVPTATTSAADECSPSPDFPKRQLRAEWIASVENIDWPSQPGLSAQAQRDELVGWLDQAVDDGLNTVILQVRPTADTFWPSRREPWSRWLTGQQGVSPGYDPLRFAVREAHTRGLELHAWFNPYRVSQDTDVDALVPNHPARVHPSWRVAYGGKLYYDQGVPDVRRHVEDVILEAVRRYDIDGVHFDDYFYPYPVGDEQFDDDASYAKYGDGFADRGDWRRHNIDLLVSELDRRIHEIKPWVAFGVSPFAVWRNEATDPRGSATQAGAETYDDLYADTRGWVQQGWVDYIAPQIYWNIGFAVADYAVLVDWWSDQVGSGPVQLYVGQATYKIGTSTQDPAWFEPGEMTSHLFLNREYPQIDGDIYFSAKDVRADRLGGMSRVVADHYQRPALRPITVSRSGTAPAAPHRVRAAVRDGGVTVEWKGNGAEYAVYRFDGAVAPSTCDLVDAEHLLGTTIGSRRFVDTTAREDAAYTYVVTALDRTHRESAASAPAVVD